MDDENAKCNIYITLRELQQVSLDLLLEFDSICKSHQIEYMLCGGTMLGAARHAGFIPWDDDVDVMMLRSEYEKLLAISKSITSKNQNRQLISSRDKTFARDYSRYITKEYGKTEKDISSKDSPWVGIDIFPIDEIPDDQDKFLQQLKDRIFWREVFVACSSTFNAGGTFLKRMARNLFRPLAFLIGRFNAAYHSEEICRRYEGCDEQDIAIVCGMYGERERWPKKDLTPLEVLSFEGHDFPVPHNYARYLSGIYGKDFMSLPPIEIRKRPHIKAWKVSV